MNEEELKRLKAEVEANNIVINLQVNAYQKLQQRIDKAIEYIKEKYYEDLYDETLTQFQDNLLEILRGEENE